MATHTKILEFYGLPGCGKTTLEKHILSLGEIEGISFCHLHDLSQVYAKQSFFRKIQAFPLQDVVHLVIMLFYLPIKQRSEVKIYKSLFYFVIIYGFCKKYKGADYVLVDHGIVQSFVSLLYGAKDKKVEKSLDKIVNFVLTIKMDYAFYFNIDATLSKSRIRSRGRTDSGRLDQIHDDNLLLTKLKLQKKQFDRIYESFHAYEPNKFHELDMSLSTETALSQLLIVINHEKA